MQLKHGWNGQYFRYLNRWLHIIGWVTKTRQTTQPFQLVNGHQPFLSVLLCTFVVCSLHVISCLSLFSRKVCYGIPVFSWNDKSFEMYNWVIVYVTRDIFCDLRCLRHLSRLQRVPWIKTENWLQLFATCFLLIVCATQVYLISLCLKAFVLGSITFSSFFYRFEPQKKRFFC